MSKKNTAKVLIGGKVITLTGYENEEYFQRIAAYINRKMADLEQLEGYHHLTVDMKNTLLSLNIADDYFKAKKQVEQFEMDMEQKENELYDIKHDLVNTQIKKEELDQTIQKYKEEISNLQKNIIQLETKAQTQK